MEISRLKISNFRSIKEADIQFGAVTVLIGTNNAGKSAILEAIRIALTRRWGQRGTGFTEYDVHLCDGRPDPKVGDPVVIEVEFQEAVANEWPEDLHGELEDIIHRAGANQDRGLLAVRLGLPEGEAWVATYHPHPQRRPRKRLEDYAGFLPLLPGPLLLAGDMNAVSPEDAPDAAALARGFERFRAPDVARREVERFVEAGRVLFRDVAPRFGLRDALKAAERGYTIPTPMLSTDVSSAMRIDFILVNGGIAVDKGWVVRGPEADVASDHYPVAADFRLALPGAPGVSGASEEERP